MVVLYAAVSTKGTGGGPLRRARAAEPAAPAGRPRKHPSTPAPAPGEPPAPSPDGPRSVPPLLLQTAACSPRKWWGRTPSSWPSPRDPFGWTPFFWAPSSPVEAPPSSFQVAASAATVSGHRGGP